MVAGLSARSRVRGTGTARSSGRSETSPSRSVRARRSASSDRTAQASPRRSRLLTRILRPDRGKSIVRGRVGALVEIAAGFHPDLTGRENVFMQGAIMGMRRAEIAAKFDEIVDFAGVAEFIDTPVKRFSSGMNARLGLRRRGAPRSRSAAHRRGAVGRRPHVPGEVLRAHAAVRPVGHRRRLRLAQPVGHLQLVQPRAGAEPWPCRDARADARGDHRLRAHGPDSADRGNRPSRRHAPAHGSDRPCC